MKSEECIVGVRVGVKNWGDTFNKGRIISPPFKDSNNREMVSVEHSPGNVGIHEINTLYPEARVIELEAAAKVEKARLEVEFNRLSAEIKVKLDAAASLVNEAQALASTVGREIKYMDGAVHTFQDALDNSGWYVSSARC